MRGWGRAHSGFTKILESRLSFSVQIAQWIEILAKSASQSNKDPLTRFDKIGS